MPLFHKRHKDKTLKVAAPVSGTILDITEVPDPVFAGKHMGPGFAVDPASGEFASPIDGEVTLVAPTLHAIGLKADNGAEILVHVGIDTVDLKGEGFTAHVKDGDTVSVGDPLLSVDLDNVKPRVPSMISPVVITNGSDFTVSERSDDPAAVLTVSAG
ncbi:PTS glucose transporter subunit IIA [Cutibacterium equinum]|uniref:PTS glucose transporter subunit IIA n=1 Tax=Cutibacterium equinum TaxID=3016342 RepID=A0ABY7QZ03_9ACTN|nr:PTS glucose transporter subunit IIA [Cutibacterium equinum]WCC80221.1 PTS glucose transporter subunit IIA [Cutibacterium equinum]